MKALLSLLVLILCSVSGVMAQGCAVCTKTAEGFGASAASSLNTGILYLAAIPVGFMGTMAYLWLKRSKQK
ncbi:hypothetical protein DBR32_11780 [Taibaiella sp. KBW10]|uniref:hypothetical protein n=1 Tax=Taibaiella sp. KBW10 TaxID=2153357 RepID=UPI000F59DD29|nr:hypothetical protein [Taibaiella sp. KBW10]RQO30248.1 hypothetical protein DBR32_11780 [Taibaiella sp. KBW10]